MARRIAFLIGNQAFRPDSGLLPLLGPPNDLAAMTRVLSDPERGRFEVHEFLDKSCHEVLPDLAQALHDAAPGDFFLVYYSGHGKLDRQGRLCLATADTRQGALLATSIPALHLRDLVEQSKCDQVVMLLDCCYSGAVEDGLRGDVDSALCTVEDARGFYIMTASTGLQAARETEVEPGGATMGRFTAALVHGIESGAADLERKGKILLSDLRYHLGRAVKGQTPQFFDRKAVGDPLISLSPSTAMPLLDPAVLADLDAEQWHRRRGSVSALAGVLREGSHIAQAAAKAALQRRLGQERDYYVRAELQAALAVGDTGTREQPHPTTTPTAVPTPASVKPAVSPTETLVPNVPARGVPKPEASPGQASPERSTTPEKESKPVLARRRLALASVGAVVSSGICYVVWQDSRQRGLQTDDPQRGHSGHTQDQLGNALGSQDAALEPDPHATPQNHSPTDSQGASPPATEPPASSTARWTPQDSGMTIDPVQTILAGTTRLLQGVHSAADGRTAWVVGIEGILATADSGNNWTHQHKTDKALSGVHCTADGRTAWAVGARGTILATIDGGRGWAPQRSKTQNDLNSVHFAKDGLTGWTVGDHGTILVTNDGGQNWTRRGSGVGEELQSVHFAPDALTGWAVGHGVILRTIDGGQSWTRQAKPVQAAPTSVHAATDGRTGWVTSDLGIFVTTDGGRNWKRQSDKDSCRAIFFAENDRIGWVASDEILATNDGGQSWISQDRVSTLSGLFKPDVSIFLFGIHFTADGRIGWAVGPYGIILATGV